MRRRNRVVTPLAVAAAILTSLAVPASSLASGPLAGWWPMNEGKGQTIYDWSGNGNHGTLGSTSGVDANDPSWTDGRFGAGRALAFSDEDIVTIADDPSLEPKRLTVSTWVRSPEPPGQFRHIVAKGSNACDAASYGLYTGHNNNIAFYIYDGTSFYVSPEGPAGIWDNNWHNVAGTFDGSRVRLFVDGRQVGSGTPVPAGTKIAYPLAQGSGTIGGYPDPACALTLRGDVDTVRIWNEALPISLYWTIARSLFNR